MYVGIIHVLRIIADRQGGIGVPPDGSSIVLPAPCRPGRDVGVGWRGGGGGVVGVIDAVGGVGGREDALLGERAGAVSRIEAGRQDG
jgi:hypothetical protein